YQDCRGRFGSEGLFTKYLDDAEDGYDTVAWLVDQPWCNGKIGTMGLSYAAHTQAALACLNPPGLACMFLDSGGFSNAYQGGIRQGGAFELKQATWAYRQALSSPEAAADPLIRQALEAADMRDWFTRMPWRKGHSPIRWVPEYEDYLFEQWTAGSFDAYWQKAGIYAAGFYDDFTDAPMMHMSSWYDPYPRTATENYVGLSQRKTGPVRLIMGPWTHGDRVLRYAGDVDFGPESVIDGNLAEDFLAMRLRWFDHWLRGVDNGVDREPKVQVFVMGGGGGRRNADGRLDHGGRWRSSADWPLPETAFTEYYLGADGSLRLEPPDFAEESLSFSHDPKNPVPTIGGAVTSGEPVMVGGAFDQREDSRFFGCVPPYLPLSSRPDVLVFETPPLQEPLEVVGPIQVKLWISSDCPDTDFTAKLIDVYPPNEDYPEGFAMILTDGILRCRYRDSWEHPKMMGPGEIYEITIEPFPTGNLFAAGHRVRLDIASSNFPHFDVNPNTGEPEGLARRSRVATNTVHMDRIHPSHILLPVVRDG
ncbi:MAG: CocE/NonD family hydrolase, partial [Alphaproteobacteria bacterium]|nr:CocE/NonD family hydrolase [Alphaproteobacteria bacterium]